MNLSRLGIVPWMVFAMSAMMAGLVAAGCRRSAPSNAAPPAKVVQSTEAVAPATEPAPPARTNEHRHGVNLELVKVDSEETSGQFGFGEFAVDGNTDTIWHTQWLSNSPGLPHEIIIELLPPSTIKGFFYLPRQDASDHGTIKDYEFYVSDNVRNFGQPVKKGTFEPGKQVKTETFEPIKARYIKLKAISEINGLPYTSAAEIGIIQSDEEAPGKDGP